MSYAIFNVVYGVPMPYGGDQIIEDLRMNEDPQYCESEFDHCTGECGFVEGYSSGGPPFKYCGVSLSVFDECGIYNLKDLKLQPTEDDLKKFEERWAQVPDVLKKLCDAPEVILVPSNS